MKEMKKVVKDIHHLLGEPRDMDRKTLSEDAFREMDADGDGKVSEQEFVAAIMAHEKVRVE